MLDWYTKRGFILENIKKVFPKTLNTDFSGSSPPEIFVGRAFYPNVFTGILAPPEHNELSYKFSSPEEWFKSRLSIEKILELRGIMIYSRFKNTIKGSNKLTEIMQEVSMSKKPLDLEFHLQKRPHIGMNLDLQHIPIGNPAPLLKAKITENVSVSRRVEYFVDDHHVKSEEAVLDLYKHRFKISDLIKLLSAGLLGLKTQRKLVPSRWSTTAIDSIISKNLLKDIRNYEWLNSFQVLSDEYLGNHYEILLLPGKWSFEVIEIDLDSLASWQDYEGFWDRKNYAFDVTGAYYSNRLAVCEYLESLKKQASIVVFREIDRKKYWAPLGVGILREVTRNAINNKKTFSSLNEALQNIQTRLRIPLERYLNKSKVLKEFKEQTTLNKFI